MEIADGEHRALVWKALGKMDIQAYIVPRLNDDIKRRLARQTLNKLQGEHDIKLDADEMALIFEAGELNNLAELIAQGRESLENILTKHKGIQFQHEDNFDVDKALEDLVPETALGDIWQLGQHRIICADCTDKKSIERLLEDKTIAQLNTDPPFGMLYGGKNEYLNSKDGGNRIEEQYDNDELEKDYREYFNSIFQNLKDKWADYNTIYIWSGDKGVYEISGAMLDSGLKISQYLVWVKNNHVAGRKDYLPKAEFCIYGWAEKHKFFSPFGGERTTVLEYDKPLSNRLHPTMKPIPMISQTIQDGTKENDIVLDVHLGSGSTLIAAEQTKRVCYGVEIDPHYCDVVVKRWEAYTGAKAVLLKPEAAQ